MARYSLRMTSRFGVVLVVLIPCLLVIMVVGVRGLQSGRDVANGLYADHLRTTQDVTGLDIALEDAHQTSLEALLAAGPAANQRLTTEIITLISPRVQAALSRVSGEVGNDPTEAPEAHAVSGGWIRFQQLLTRGALRGGTVRRADPTARDITILFR